MFFDDVVTGSPLLRVGNHRPPQRAQDGMLGIGQTTAPSRGHFLISIAIIALSMTDAARTARRKRHWYRSITENGSRLRQ